MSTSSDPWQTLLDPDDDAFAADPDWRPLHRPGAGRTGAGGVSVVVGGAGGMGASTVAAALAICAARRDGRVLLVDLDLVWGDLHGAWGIPRDRTLHDLAPVIDELTAEHLAVVTTPPVDGVSLLLSPGSAHAAQQWSGAMVERLLGVAAGGGCVVIDAGRAAPEHLAAAAGLADRIVVVATPSMRGARGAAAVLSELGPASVLVANHIARHEEIGLRAFARICGARPIVEVPRRPRDAELLASGRTPRGHRQPILAAIDQILDGQR